jgi:hypothetical protein
MPSSSAEVACAGVFEIDVMHRPDTPSTVREKLGTDGTEGLEKMFADAYVLANESFERRLEVETGKLHLAIANLRFEMVKWMFLFWAMELAAIGGIVFAVVKAVT